MIVKINSSKRSLLQASHSNLSSTPSTKVNIKLFCLSLIRIHWKSIKKNELIYAKSATKNNDILLDPNHTHFILVDDGSEGQFGKEIEFRAHFEAELRKGRSLKYYEEKINKKKQSHENSEKETSEDEYYVNDDIEYHKKNSIPMVLIVVQGGPNTLLTSNFHYW